MYTKTYIHWIENLKRDAHPKSVWYKRFTLLSHWNKIKKSKNPIRKNSAWWFHRQNKLLTQSCAFTSKQTFLSWPTKSLKLTTICFLLEGSLSFVAGKWTALCLLFKRAFCVDNYLGQAPVHYLWKSKVKYPKASSLSCLEFSKSRMEQILISASRVTPGLIFSSFFLEPRSRPIQRRIDDELWSMQKHRAVRRGRISGIRPGPVAGGRES